MVKAKEMPPSDVAPQTGMRKLHCYRCGGEWWPKNPDKVPTVCARCKNPRWNVPRAELKTEETPAERRAMEDYLIVLRMGTAESRALRALVEARVAALEGDVKK